MKNKESANLFPVQPVPEGHTFAVGGVPSTTGQVPPSMQGDDPTEPALKASRIRVRYDDVGRQRVDVITTGGTVVDISNVSNSVVIIKKGEPRVELTVPLCLADVKRVDQVTYAK